MPFFVRAEIYRNGVASVPRNRSGIGVAEGEWSNTIGTTAWNRLRGGSNPIAVDHPAGSGPRCIGMSGD